MTTETDIDLPPVRAVVLHEGDLWVAQCLEYDIGAQAPDLDSLRTRLDVALRFELMESLERTGQPFGGIDPAPRRFHDLWEKRARSFTANDGGPGMRLDMALVA